MAAANPSCVRQDGRISLLNPETSPERYNEISGQLGFEWVDREDEGQCRIDLAEGSGLTYGEIIFSDEVSKSRYTTSDGKLNTTFERVLRDVISTRHNHVIYQVVLDRWRNGNPDNDLPFYAYPTSNAWSREMWRGMLDRARGTANANLNLIQGGDLEGFVETLPYLQELGITRVWMSPIYRNALGFAEGGGHYKTKYHGYWASAFDEIDPGLVAWRMPEGSSAETIDWQAAYEKYAADKQSDDQQLMHRVSERARARGIGLVLDVVLNHTNPIAGAENGDLYFGGRLFCSLKGDGAVLGARECFHLNPDIPWDESGHEDFQLKLWNWSLSGLADLRQDTPQVMRCLVDSNLRWMPYVEGIRIDTLKHVEPRFYYRFVAAMRERNPDLHVFGEWWDAAANDAQSTEYIRYGLDAAPQTQLDFGLRNYLHAAFAGPDSAPLWGEGGSMALGDYLALNAHRGLKREYVTFWNSHDFPRFLNNAIDREIFERSGIERQKEYQDEGLKAMFCVRGIPNVYYGDEFHMFDETWSEGFFGKGGDPYNRPNMIFPDDYRERPGFKLLKALVKLRRENPALRFGSTQVAKFSDATGKPDPMTLAFVREAFGNSVLYLHVRGEDIFKRLAGYSVNWPDGEYTDSLTGLKYRVGGGRISLVDGQYQNPVNGRAVTVANGAVEGSAYHTIILTRDELVGEKEVEFQMP